MATYGAYITNRAGNALIEPGENYLLYWGKVEVTGNTNQTVSLFNLPTNVPVRVYFHLQADGYRTRANLVKGATWSMLVSSGKPGTIFSYNVTAYVFVDARYVPLQKYGMAIYNDKVEPVWHTARPGLQIREILSVGADTPAVLVPYKAAAPMILMKVYNSGGSRPPRNAYFDYTAAGRIHYNTAPPAGQSYIGVNSYLLSNISPAPIMKSGINIPLGIIDCAKYDAISNLGNYV